MKEICETNVFLLFCLIIQKRTVSCLKSKEQNGFDYWAVCVCGTAFLCSYVPFCVRVKACRLIENLMRGALF